MDLNELYKSLGQWITVRDGIQKEISTLQSQSGNNTHRRKDQIHSLEDQYDEVQQNILKIDRDIRTLEEARAALRN